MSSIYVDQHCDLSELLKKAFNDQGATLLIPDLQRPFVWTPRQVVLLLDSLLRGWPFGTFLTWKVAKDDPVRELARPFWKVVDKTDGEQGEQVSKMNPPGTFEMVLDGQQRIQSLLLAVCGDSWGFKMYDRDWHVALTDEKPRSRQGIKHWSLGCLCLDLEALLRGYKETKRVLSLDFTDVLKWAITGGNAAQSEEEKRSDYRNVLPRTDELESKGRYVRLSRIWDATPMIEGIEQDQAEGIAERLLRDHEIHSERVRDLLKPIGSLIANLTRVKRTRVTFLELVEFDSLRFKREAYNDAVVNIFTRLNTAGRTLTSEDITFAWLKIGWEPARTQNKSASACFEDLSDELEKYSLDLSMENLVAGISFMWSSVHSGGKLLNNNDLLNGKTIRPMATDLSENWDKIVSAVSAASAAVDGRGLLYRQQYQSLNSLFVLWAWSYIAERWLRAHSELKELEKDGFTKRITDALNEFADRWLFCSQWAGRWAAASAQALAGYSMRLHECAKAVNEMAKAEDVSARLRDLLEGEVRALETDALNYIQALSVARRELVRVYFSALWIWHRLKKERWEKSKIQLRIGKRMRTSLDVDHTVAFGLWEKKLETGLPKEIKVKEDAIPIVNRLGNCSLLEKSFNISKSDKALKLFIEEVHEIKENKVSLNDWADALSIKTAMLDPRDADATVIAEAIDERDKLIRAELVEFIKGAKTRVDLQ